MRIRHLLTPLVALTLTSAALAADTAPAASKPAETPFLIGEVHMQTLPATTIIFTSAETTFDKIGDTAMAGVAKIQAARDKGAVKMDGPSVFIYTNITGMDKPFTLDMGLIVPADAKDAGDLKVKKLPEFKCATILYTGPLSNLPKVYEKIIGEVLAKGLTMTGENREMYLFWEKPDGANNVTQIQIGIK